MKFTNEKYFDIDKKGYVSLKEEYREDKSLKEIIIPNKINGIDVKGIKDRAFYYSPYLIKVCIPDDVRENMWMGI